MKHIISILVLVVVSYSVSGQVYTNTSNYGNGFTRLRFDSSVKLPTMTVPHMSTNLTGPGFIVYNTSDSSLYTYDGVIWHKVANGSNTSSVQLYTLVINSGNQGNTVTISDLINKTILEVDVGNNRTYSYIYTASTGLFDFTAINGVYATTLHILYKN